jgi:lactate permease
MYQQDLNHVGGSLGLTALVAVVPLVTLFVLLGGLRWKAHKAALTSLAVALVVAIAAYGMPVGQAFDSGLEGAVFGLFPIMWIVVNAIWIYNMTVKSGHFAVLRGAFAKISDDQRIQAVIIAFSFGALLEALAGFGTPVAICSVMLIALGFKPLKAVGLALVADTAPVAFGAIAVPITTLSQTSTLPAQDLASMVGRQTPILALIVPFIMIGMVDGRRGLRACWPVGLVAGAGFAIGQFTCSNYISIELTDIVASLLSAGCVVALLQVWRPGEPVLGEGVRTVRPAIAGGSTADPTFERQVRARSGRGDGFGAPQDEGPGTRRTIEAFVPYGIIIALFAIAEGPLKHTLANTVKTFSWPGLHVVNAKGKALTSLTFKFDYLPAAGTILLIAGLLTVLALRIRPGDAVRAYGASLNQLKWAIVTVASVLALAYVMNQSGQTLTLGTWLAGAGTAFAFLSPMVGWLGTAVTGSDTSSNALFGALQVQAAHNAGLNDVLMASSNSSGGVLAKMVSPQNLAIGSAAVGMAGREGDIFRYVIKWSLVLLLFLCVLVTLQATAVLSWMVP